MGLDRDHDHARDGSPRLRRLTARQAMGNRVGFNVDGRVPGDGGGNQPSDQSHSEEVKAESPPSGQNRRLTAPLSKVLIVNANRHSSARQKLAIMFLTALVVWLLLAGPAYWMRGVLGLEGLSYAGMLCLVPGWLVVYVTTRYPEADSQAKMVLLGTGLRMAFVLIGMVMLKNLRPDLGHYEFQLWLILYYLAFLFVETLLVVKSTNSQQDSAHQEG